MPPPDLFTVTEAAVVLRIGRTTAYDLVRRDFASGGGEGLEVVRIGGQFRIPRSPLERVVGGPVTWPAFPDSTHRSASGSEVTFAEPQHPLSSDRPKSPVPGTPEPTLPFT